MELVMKEISRNPSFTPSPALREYLNQHEHGVTFALNELFDRYQMLIELDAIRLTKDEVHTLKEHLMGVFIDNIAIQVIPQDIEETGCDTLINKMSNATFGQTLATLKKYQII